MNHNFKVGDRLVYRGATIEDESVIVAECGYIVTVESLDGCNHMTVKTKDNNEFSVHHSWLNYLSQDKKFHSSHYESDAIEPISYIMGNNMSFNRGNIIKYASRVGKKENQEKLDCHKILDYMILLAIEEGIPLDRKELIDLINYRFDWSDRNVYKKQ